MTGDARVAVVLASAGRPELLGDVLADLSRQTFKDFDVVVSVPDDDSLPAGGPPPGVLVVYGRGAAAQRNRGLDAVADATHVFFFDDDAVIREDYLEQAMAYFTRHPDVVALTGRVLLDGAAREEIRRKDAERVLADSCSIPLHGAATRIREVDAGELYGCNFGFAAALAGGERFDERLPLYSWLEDHDLARRLMRRGPIVRIHDAVIVHRGVKSGGRMAHGRLGYSQVMNPAYLHRKGSFSLWLALREALPLVAKNLLRSVRGPEADWRRERLRGNLRAAADVARRRFTPERILEMQ